MAAEEEPEDPEEGADATEEVAAAPSHGRGPDYLDRHHAERHLELS